MATPEATSVMSAFTGWRAFQSEYEIWIWDGQVGGYYPDGRRCDDGRGRTVSLATLEQFEGARGWKEIAVPAWFNGHVNAR